MARGGCVDRDANTLAFRYYGASPGRTVEIECPVEGMPVKPEPPVYCEDPALPKGQIR